MALIALLLPAGGAVLTVRNLQRLGQVDARWVRDMTAAIIVVFTAGITAILLLGRGTSSATSETTWIVSGGVALGSYSIQRVAFRHWRSQHAGTRTAPWLRALGVAAAFELLTLAALLPVAVALVLTGHAPT